MEFEYRLVGKGRKVYVGGLAGLRKHSRLTRAARVLGGFGYKV
ncbi:MAG: hypothetical protein PVF15_10555 [Candidatus Bathyarchaeota archaeon]